MESQVLHGNCFDILPTLPDKSIFSIITDPPYGIKLDKWDIPVDIPVFTAHAARLSTGFYCFFGQMPTMLNWANEATKVMQYKDHISWVKRNCMMHPGLIRGHESIFIFRQKGNQYYKTTGAYSDVKVPGLMFDVITIEGIQRHISHLYFTLKNNGKPKEYVISHKAQSAYIRDRIKRNELGKTSTRANILKQSNFTNVWSFLSPTQSKQNGRVKFQHPTQKPLELMNRLVELTTPPDHIVLDPFGGSGTTAIACLETGRKYICIEQSIEYHQMILDRIEAWHEDKQTQQQELNLDG